MNKPKQPQVKHYFPIDWVAPLQLEVCAERLRQDLTASNMRVLGQHTIHDDKIHCTIQLYKSQRITTQAQITLSRWQDTMTHIEGEGIYRRVGIHYKFIWLIWLLFSIVYLAVFRYEIDRLDFWVSRMTPTPEFLVIIAIIILFVIYLALAYQFVRLSQYLERQELIRGLKTLLKSNPSAKENR